MVIHSCAAPHLDDREGDSPFRATRLEGPLEVEMPDGCPQPCPVMPPAACSALGGWGGAHPNPGPAGLRAYDFGAGKRDPEPFFKTPRYPDINET